MAASRFWLAVLLGGALAGSARGARRAITGHVYDKQRRPVANALVGVRCHNDSPRLLTSSGDDHVGRNAGFFVRSSVDGAFRVEVPAAWGVYADSALDLVAVALNFAPYVVRFGPELSTADVVLSSAPWRSYTITARTPDDRPASVATARIVVGAGDSAVLQVSADRTGTMTVPAPAISSLPVVVSMRGYRPVETEPFLYRDTTKTGITVTLRPVIAGVVEDERGHAKPGIGVFLRGAPTTVAEWKSQITEPYFGTVTDSTGRYTLAPTMRVDPDGRRFEGRDAIEEPEFDVVFADSLFTRVAFARTDPAPSGATTIAMDVTLRPTREVHVPVVEPRRTVASGPGFVVGIETAPTFGARDSHATHVAPAKVISTYYADSARAVDGSIRREAVFRLPPGRYRVVVHRLDVNASGAWFNVSTGTVPLTTEEQRPSILPAYARLGQPAPELQAIDLDGRPIRLADYRGRVVVLDFWSYWCEVCIHDLKTSLIPFAKEYAGQPVIVLALHDASVRSRAEYDSVFRRLKGAVFDGRDLPFPVLLDRPTAGQRALAFGDRQEGDGETTAAYSVSAYPTTILIDTHGTLANQVDAGDPAQLRRAVEPLLKEATGTGP